MLLLGQLLNMGIDLNDLKRINLQLALYHLLDLEQIL